MGFNHSWDDVSVTPVTHSYNWPHSAVARLAAVFPDGSTVVGTGTMVGANDVLTAAHLVWNPAAGGAATSVTVTPGQSGLDAGAFGSHDAGSWDYFKVDADGDRHIPVTEVPYDLAIVGLTAPVGVQTGTLAMGPDVGACTTRTTGYVGLAERDYQVDVTAWSAPREWLDSEGGVRWIGNLDLPAGMAGAPVWVDPAWSDGWGWGWCPPRVAGVVATDNWAAWLGPAWDQLRAWAADNNDLLTGAAARGGAGVDISVANSDLGRDLLQAGDDGVWG